MLNKYQQELWGTRDNEVSIIWTHHGLESENTCPVQIHKILSKYELKVKQIEGAYNLPKQWDWKGWNVIYFSGFK